MYTSKYELDRLFDGPQNIFVTKSASRTFQTYVVIIIGVIYIGHMHYTCFNDKTFASEQYNPGR